MALLRSTLRWTARSSEVHTYTTLCSAPTHSTHKPHSIILMIEAVYPSETSQHRTETQKNKINCFHVSTTVQAQCVHNNAASCSTVTATYHCNQHTNFQTPQHYKQFTIQTVRTHSLHFPCRHSNKLLSQTLCTVQSSVPHNSTHQEMSQAHFPFSLLQGTASFVYYPLYELLCVRQGPVFLPSNIILTTNYSILQHVKFNVTKLTSCTLPDRFSLPYLSGLLS